MKRLILLASPTLRRGPLSALQRYVRDYEDFLATFKIFTTEGCRRALQRCGILVDYSHFGGELPGYLGGVVHLSSLVVSDPARMAAVIYLIDPRDPSSIYPETNAIKRECVVHQVMFLSTSRAAREWAAINWGAPPPYFLPPEVTKQIPVAKPLAKEVIALIAHDGRKKQLLDFASEHFDFLLRFGKRVGTGTTGGLLNGNPPNPARLTPEECEELKPVCTKLKKQIAAAKRRGTLASKFFVEAQESGPKGGDVMIAHMVLAGACEKIMFFENPLKPHEHTEDIQLLERTGRLRGKSTLCVHDSKTATWFVNYWASHADSYDAQPLLISTMLERLFGVKCVLVKSDLREGKELHEEVVWREISTAAGWFVLSHVATLAAERRARSDSVRVCVGWGVGMADVVNGIPARVRRLRGIDTQPTPGEVAQDEAIEDSGGYSDIATYSYQKAQLADERFMRPGNVIVAPMQGLVGSEVEDVEGNEIARSLAEILGGQPLLLAANALVRAGGDPMRRKEKLLDSERHWTAADMVLLTANPLQARYPARPRIPHFEGFEASMGRRRACGDIGGVFLNELGREVPPEGLERVGMTEAQIRSARGRRGVVLIAGAQQERIPIVLASLLGGWISVLISDTAFATQLVRQSIAYVTDGAVSLRTPENPGPLVESAQYRSQNPVRE